MSTEPGFSRPVLAGIAFMGHIPGLKLLTRARFTPMLVRVNVVAAVATVAAMVVAGLLAEPGAGAMAVFWAWLIGHFAWSFVFAGWILGGGAIAESTP
ncbi:MAG: hypothetical protein AAF799_31055 [Myxococcota bacterium]